MGIQQPEDAVCDECGMFNVRSTICVECANNKVKKALEQVFPTWRINNILEIMGDYQGAIVAHGGWTDQKFNQTVEFLENILKQREKEALKKKKQSEEFWGKIAKW